MKIQVSGSDIKILERQLVVTEAINAYVIKFKFDKSWNEMVNKTVVFYQPKVNRDHPIYLLINEDNTAYIPAETLIDDDFLYIGVFGFTMDGLIRLPTVYTYTYVERGCFRISQAPIPPISVYEEIYSMALKAWSAVEDLRRQAESGEFDGFSPTITVKEDTSTSYILTITTKDGSFDTPNLIAEGSGDLSYTHDQVEPSDHWEITHNLKKFPSVTVVDSANTAVYGEVNYIDLNNVVINFSSEFSGKAYLN